MSIVDAVTRKLFDGRINKLVKEQLPAAVSLSLNDVGWRRLTGAPTRELPMMDQGRAIEVAYWLWKTNPMARWIIGVITAFATSRGVPFMSKNEDVKEVLDGFWFDAINRMDLSWEGFVRELGIYGEQCWPVFVAEQTGRVRIGYVDPAHIEIVETDPENVRVKIGVKIGGVNGGRPRSLRIVLDREVEQFLSPAGKARRDTYSDGQCFYFNINALTNELRGTSDLFTVADHLDNYEQIIWDSSEKHARFNAFYYDITVSGADEAKLDKERSKYQPPKTGEAFIHNEQVKSEAISPDMKSLDSDAAARMHRNHILGAVGLPEHWYGGGGDVNRATASEMGAPALKMIEARQNTTKNMLEIMFDFVIASALESGFLRVPEDEAYDYEVQTPEISDKDVAKLSTMLSQVAQSLVSAETQGWITKDEAAKAYAYFLNFVGYEYTPEEGMTDKGLADYAQDYQGVDALVARVISRMAESGKGKAESGKGQAESGTGEA